MIHIKNLHKHFGDNHVLRGIDCDIKPQEVVCIIGPSGSGKSTFLRCMNALETVTEGEVMVNGFAVHDRKTDLNKMRESVGMVFQRFNLFPHMTVLDNLMMAPQMLLGLSRRQVKTSGYGLMRSARNTMSGLTTSATNTMQPSNTASKCA